MAHRVLYRAFLQAARELERRGQPLVVQLPVQSSRVQWYGNPDAPQSQYTSATLAAVMQERFPWVPEPGPAGPTRCRPIGPRRRPGGRQ